MSRTRIQTFLKTHIFIRICDRSAGKRFPNYMVSVSGFFRELKRRTGRRQRQRERETSEGLDKQNNNFACASRFFVYFFAVVARLRLESTVPNFHVLWKTWTRDNDFIFLFLNFDRSSPLEYSSPEKIANIGRIERGEIEAIKFETGHIHFLVTFL